MKKFFKSGLFSPKLRINKIKNLSSLQQLNSEDGFTLVELIVVVMMIGILSSIAIPQFMTAADKAKQKEAQKHNSSDAVQNLIGWMPKSLAISHVHIHYQRSALDPATRLAL